MGKNGEVWACYFDAKAGHPQDPLAYKIKAHNEEAYLRGQMDVEHYVGNLVADAVSGVISEQEVDTLLERDLGKWQAISFMVARRIGIIERECWDSDPKSVPLDDEQPLMEMTNKQHRDRLMDQLRGTKHRVVRVKKIRVW